MQQRDNDFTLLASQHAELIQQISKYDNAPAELSSCSLMIRNAEKDLATRQGRIDDLVKRRKSEHKDIEKLQRSGTKRLLVRLTKGGSEGLSRVLEKEEKEYVEAAQAEYNENQIIDFMRESLSTLKKLQRDLTEQVELRRSLQDQLDDFYQSAFSGPTPEFPKEDVAESELIQAESCYEYLHARVATEKEVLNRLSKATTFVSLAQGALDPSIRTLKQEYTYRSQEKCTEAENADNLLKAQSFATQAQNMFDWARYHQPLIKPVQCGVIASPNWVHVVFDNMFTDFMFQQKVKQSFLALQSFKADIDKEHLTCTARINDYERIATEAYENLKSKRQTLFIIRRDLLLQLLDDKGAHMLTKKDKLDADSKPQLHQTQLGGGTMTMPIPVHEQLPPEYSSTGILTNAPEFLRNEHVPTSTASHSPFASMQNFYRKPYSPPH